MELLVPTVSDIVFKYTWCIPNYRKTVSKRSLIDSPSFDVNVNGIHCTWNLSIRFWKGPEGKRITNPVVLCLNILNCTVDEVEQAKIRFQFAVYNADVKHWEYCHVSRTVLELKSSTDILSLGYRDLSIVDRHLKKNGEVDLMVKIQIIQCESEKHSLTQDMARLLKHPRGADTKLTCGGLNGTEIPVHSSVIAARSPILADMISPLIETHSKGQCGKNEKRESDSSGVQSSIETESSEFMKDNENGHADRFESLLTSKNAISCGMRMSKLCEHSPIDAEFHVSKSQYMFSLELDDISKEHIDELLRYIYCDHVDNLDALAPQLLCLAERFCLQGLRELCERNLIETITPENVACRLLIADEFGCEALKRAGMAYCEENVMMLNKSFAWKMMEQVNPELFNEVCEAGLGSSRSSNMDDSELSN